MPFKDRRILPELPNEGEIPFLHFGYMQLLLILPVERVLFYRTGHQTPHGSSQPASSSRCGCQFRVLAVGMFGGWLVGGPRKIAEGCSTERMFPGNLNDKIWTFIMLTRTPAPDWKKPLIERPLGVMRCKQCAPFRVC